MTDNLPTQIPSVPSEHELTVYNTMAKQAVESKFYRTIGSQDAVMMIMLSARELGIPAMQALNGGLHLIQGKVEISARMMSALIRRAGHSIQIKESTDLKCILEGKRADNGDTGVAEYSMEEAKRAGLVKKGGGWEKHPSDMLFARALSRLARQLFSDVVGVGYVEGEIPRDSQRKRDPEPIQEVECEVVEDNQESIDKCKQELFKDLDKEDKMLLQEYAKVVMEHFSWTEKKTWNTMAQDVSETHNKFRSWRDKKALMDGNNDL